MHDRIRPLWPTGLEEVAANALSTIPNVISLSWTWPTSMLWERALRLWEAYVPVKISQSNWGQLLINLFTNSWNFSWFSQLEGSRWFQLLSGLLRAAVAVAAAMEREARPVLVHCSDGWDRTPQIVALAQLLLDPYYRTIEVRGAKQIPLQLC